MTTHITDATVNLAINNLIDAANADYDFDWYFTYDDCPVMQLYELYDPQHQKNLINVLPEMFVDVQVVNATREDNTDCGMKVNTWLGQVFASGLLFEANQIVD